MEMMSGKVTSNGISFRTFQNASEKKRQELRKEPEYQSICKYKFIVDKNNTIEKRKLQSTKDKEKSIQEKNQYYQSLQKKACQKQDSKAKYKCVPKCPICNSTDIQKLSTTSKIIGVGLLGLASKTVGKTYKCKKCGYYW